jgi:ATP-binding cassette subfamily B (MDR/TAP) protein 1
VKVELKNIWFKYPTRDVPVLQGLNMTVGVYHLNP